MVAVLLFEMEIWWHSWARTPRISSGLSAHFSREPYGSFQPGLARAATAQVPRGPVPQAVWLELRSIDGPQAEACATQDGRTPQRDLKKQADIAEQICQPFERYPG
jgi:hypothetical protein